MHHQYGRGMMGYSGFTLFWIILSLILILVVLFLSYKLVQRSKRDEQTQSNALIILKERYAKGEITEEEYEHKRKVIDE